MDTSFKRDLDFENLLFDMCIYCCELCNVMYEMYSLIYMIIPVFTSPVSGKLDWSKIVAVDLNHVVCLDISTSIFIDPYDTLPSSLSLSLNFSKSHMFLSSFMYYIYHIILRSQKLILSLYKPISTISRSQTLLNKVSIVYSCMHTTYTLPYTYV